MEGIHGVDVSWLHHSSRDHAQKSASVSEQKASSPPVEPSPLQNGNPPAKSNGVHHTLHNPLHRPHLGRATSDKDESSPQISPQNPSSTPPQTPPQTLPKGSKELKLASTGRRGSWMTSLSSKFSSSSNVSPAAASPETPADSKGPKSPQSERSNPLVPNSTPKDNKKADSPSPTPPGSPKPSHTFLQSALRRLSSGGASSIGKISNTGTGGICPRKTMNVDPYRDRCALPELDENKLRRVSFCVDVEIAGSAQYVDDIPDDSKPDPPIDAPSSLTKLNKELESKKAKDQKSKDQKLKRSEGEALKRPDVVAEEKEQDGVVKKTGEDVSNKAEASDSKIATPGAPNPPTKEASTKKKEKKKRSEGERKERKERKQREALANGIIPAEIKSDGSGDSATGADTPPKSQDRPTTDPLRIYRRCCQLRETPILKRIAEQISSPSACPVLTPGILTCLDLSGYWMQLSDIITLGDYLAVVPVKKLVMENCGLGDEAIRVLLAGLLAAKTPEQAKYNRKLGKKSKLLDKDTMERLGVVEKVSFKNNPKISKTGWRHIATFIYMSKSLKAIDLSMMPFPDSSVQLSNIKSTKSNNSDTSTTTSLDMSAIFQEAVSGRLAGNQLEELVMAECGLSTESIGQIIDAAIKCGTTRLGLASNNITVGGMEHIVRYVRSGVCMGLDIGGNDIHQHINMLADAIGPSNTLWALSLADCHLIPSSLERLLPALAGLGNFRFIDLSHNRNLFAMKPSALGLIRKHLPQITTLKRLHLMDVAMTSEHAIALAETLPECHILAHLNILENHLLTPLASAKTEAEQEEACALYASLMAAVRVSDSIICIDIDVPSPDSSEIVKALAKQVVAYSLHNLERLPLSVSSDSAIASMKQPHGGEKGLTVPDVLIHLVGHVDGFPENHDHDPPAPDDDYIVGGTGVVKALDICLNRAEARRKDSADISPLQSGTGTPKTSLQDGEITKGKAKEMSKNLLGSARKIRARLQPALVKEAKEGSDVNYRRLVFLDSTLRGMIQRFEDEYPETRLPPASDTTTSNETAEKEDIDPSTILPNQPAILSPSAIVDDEDNPSTIRPGNLSRRASSPSLLASRQAQEEGRIHRISQRIKRDILRPEGEDHAHGTTGLEGPEPESVRALRQKLEQYGGEEMRAQIERMGPEALFRALEAEKEGDGYLSEELERWRRKAEEEGGAEEVRNKTQIDDGKTLENEEERGRKMESTTVAAPS